MSDNIAVVRQFFAALERGDLHGVIELVGKEVDWQSPVTRTHTAEVPWSRIRRTKQEVGEFFKELGQKVKPEGFRLLQITSQGDRVVVEGQNRGIVHETQQSYEHDWVMIFSVSNNKIVRLRHYYDTGDLLGSPRSE
ncbi:MAG: nuclear transport factor 2 family protein [bacterium]